MVVFRAQNFLSIGVKRMDRKKSSREAARLTFVEKHHWAQARMEALPADASARRYYRLRDEKKSVLLMDAPPAYEPVAPFVKVARHLCALGLSAPQILACDEEQGFLLLEDFGVKTYTHCLEHGDSAQGLYETAVRCLAELHCAQGAADIDLPPYDLAAFLREALLLVDWYFPAVSGQIIADSVRQAYVAAWCSVFDDLTPQTPTIVLRDFHVDNLMLLSERTGINRCGVLDFQDTLIGPPAYDLVSVLEDARRDVGPDVRAAVLDVYCTGLCEDEKQSLFRDMRLLGAQRHAKVLGIFVRLWRRDGKPGYLRHLPRVQRLLCTALEDPCLRPVADYLKRLLPDLAAVRITAGDDPTDDTGAREQDQTPSTASNSLS